MGSFRGSRPTPITQGERNIEQDAIRRRRIWYLISSILRSICMIKNRKVRKKKPERGRESSKIRKRTRFLKAFRAVDRVQLGVEARPRVPTSGRLPPAVASPRRGIPLVVVVDDVDLPGPHNAVERHDLLLARGRRVAPDLGPPLHALELERAGAGAAVVVARAVRRGAAPGPRRRRGPRLLRAAAAVAVATVGVGGALEGGEEPGEPAEEEAAEGRGRGRDDGEVGLDGRVGEADVVGRVVGVDVVRDLDQPDEAEDAYRGDAVARR